MYAGVIYGPLPVNRPPIAQFLGDLLSGLMYAVTHPTSVRSSLANLVVDLLDAGSGAGTLEFQASNDAEVATCTFGDPAFGAASSGVATANAITEDSSATGGTTTKFVAEDSDGNPCFLGSVGTSGEDINLSSVTLSVNDELGISSLTYTAAA